MSSPLDSTFSTSPTAAPRGNLSCALSDSLQFFMNKENWKSKFKLKSDHWGIYGHGAGAHFVHRYVLHNPEASHTLAIAANLGWYLSMTDQTWPFGLSDSGIDNMMLKQAFSKYFLLMLGRADTSTKPNTAYVKEHWDIISSQGEHRLARGRNFFKSAEFVSALLIRLVRCIRNM